MEAGCCAPKPLYSAVPHFPVNSWGMFVGLGRGQALCNPLQCLVTTCLSLIHTRQKTTGPDEATQLKAKTFLLLPRASLSHRHTGRGGICSAAARL